MPYLNIDDGMDEHPKIEFLSDAAFRLHMRAMLYCARRQTDGFVPLAKVRKLIENADIVAAELVDAGVWHDLGDGCTDRECVDARTCHRRGRGGQYIVHDYLQWNHSKDWWERRRKDQAERKARSRERLQSQQEHGPNVTPLSHAPSRVTHTGQDA